MTTRSGSRLRVDAPAREVRALGRALARLAAEEPETFAGLFAPTFGRVPVAVRAPEVAYLLEWFGLAVRVDRARYLGRSRVRRRGGRMYVMEIGSARGEYFQDVWPETDALLAALDGVAPARVLDQGTGTGIVAVEAAVLGHRVVATDVYETALELARFNAALNGVDGIAFRRGHLFDPVLGERFDLILTAPHYTRVSDQLRLEVLRDAPAFLAPGGTAVIATFLEWEGDGEPAALPTILAPHAARGVDITVEPLVARFKREWFTAMRADEDAPIPRLVSRNRFLVTMRPGAGGLVVHRPREDELLRQRIVPLARLHGARARAARGWAPPLLAVASGEDVAALEQLLAQLAAGLVRFESVVPAGLLDGCRFGAAPCVTPKVTDGAAGAILDVAGNVRPCVHGGAIARYDDPLRVVMDRLRAASAAAAERRGCAECPAQDVCSRCLFPGPLDEAHYCALVVAHTAELAALARLQRTLRWLLGAPAPVLPPLRVKLRRHVALVAAEGRPVPSGELLPRDAEARVARLAERWREREAWLAVDGGRRAHLLLRERGMPLAPPIAEIGELAGDGATGAELILYLRGQGYADAVLEPSLGHLERLLE